MAEMLPLDSDKMRLRRLRIALLGAVLITASAAALDHFGVVGARHGLALANGLVLVMGALIASMSLACFLRRRDGVFVIDLFLGLGIAVISLAWLVPMYLWGVLDP